MGLHSADDYSHIHIREQWAFQPSVLEMEQYWPCDMHLMHHDITKSCICLYFWSNQLQVGWSREKGILCIIVDE